MPTKSERIVWGIHGGVGGDARDIFIKKNQIALGWDNLGDLSKLPKSRDAYKDKMKEVMPDRKEGYYPVAAGQIYRFVNEMKKGDVIVYPSKPDRTVYIGEVTGEYIYVKDEDGYSQRRAVKWIKTLPRTKFSQGALYEIGSALSFFQIKTYFDEFLTALEGNLTAQPPKKDETVGYVAKEVEEATHDYILKTLAQELKGHAFADFVAHLLNTMGYKTRVASEGPDGGIDIIAHKDELGFVPPIIKVQVKSTEGSIGEPIVSQLYGKVDKSEFGMFVTLGTFTNQAITFARNKSNLRLIDTEAFVDLILSHYEKFDSKYKALLPLKKVYIPEQLEESEE